MNRIVSDYSPYTLKKQQTYTKLDNFKLKIMLKSLVLGVFIVSLCIVYIWSRVQIVQTGYEINNLKKNSVLLSNEYKKLNMELSLLSNPSRLESFSEKYLNMKMPHQSQIVKLK